MDELNCGQGEQNAGPEKKKSTSKIVKRTLVVAALALAVYGEPFQTFAIP